MKRDRNIAFKFADFVKNFWLIASAKKGVQRNLKILDSRFRGNDTKREKSIVDGCISFRILAVAFFCLLLFISPFARAETEKKYPPYPDKWLFEIDFSKFYKHPSCIQIAKMENGDLLMMEEKYKGKLIFEDRNFQVKQKDYEKFCKKYRNNKIQYAIIGTDLSDGTRLYKTGSSKQCYTINPHGIWFRGINKVYWIIKPLEESRNIYDYKKGCDRTASIKREYIIERFDTSSNHIVPLEDGTFLVFLAINKEGRGYEGKLIVRFKKNMKTKSNIFEQGEYYFFEIYEFIEWEKKHGIDYGSIARYNIQTRIDNVMEYIKTLN